MCGLPFGKPVEASAPLQPIFPPIVMSLNAPSPSMSYSHGFRKPRVCLPADNLAELRRAIKDANVGAEADVPLMNVARPLSYMA